MTHTPEWHFDALGNIDDGNKRIGYCEEVNDAARAVKAVNSHDELVEALKIICEQFETTNNKDAVLVAYKSI